MSAILESQLAAARLVGRKARARANPPTAATGGFPYPARTCDEWEDNGMAREMTDEERAEDARNGSELLRSAIVRMAA